MSATLTLVAETPGALALFPLEPEPPLPLFEVDPFEELLQAVEEGLRKLEFDSRKT